MTVGMFLSRSMLFVLLSLLSSQTMASVIITGTRLVYQAEEKEITVQLNNNGQAPVLVQAWIDTGDQTASPTQSQSAFVISPPVFRMDPGEGQSLRLMFTRASVPLDKESVYWFNVLEIPSDPSGEAAPTNMLQMAFRSRIKLFYRPVNLPGKGTDPIGQIKWRAIIVANSLVLEGHNPSAYHVTITDIALLDGGERTVANAQMIAPGTTHRFAFPALKKLPGPLAQVEYSAINDFGADIVLKQPVTP